MKKLITLTTALILTGAIALFCDTSDAVSEPVEVAQEIVKEIEKPELTEAQIEALKESCVMIYADDGETQVQGSGVAIGDNKYLTVYHAIADNRTNLKTSDGEKLTVDKAVPTIDIMTLDSAYSATPVNMGDIANYKSGDKIVVIGAPDGNDDTVTRTTINRIVGVIVINGATVGGASGSGVFDMRGNLIGIVTRTDMELDESYAVTINTILEKL